MLANTFRHLLCSISCQHNQQVPTLQEPLTYKLFVDFVNSGPQNWYVEHEWALTALRPNYRKRPNYCVSMVNILYKFHTQTHTVDQLMVTIFKFFVFCIDTVQFFCSTCSSNPIIPSYVPNVIGSNLSIAHPFNTVQKMKAWDYTHENSSFYLLLLIFADNFHRVG